MIVWWGPKPGASLTAFVAEVMGETSGRGGEGNGGMWVPEIVLAGQAYLIFLFSPTVVRFFPVPTVW